MSTASARSSTGSASGSACPACAAYAIGPPPVRQGRRQHGEDAGRREYDRRVPTAARHGSSQRTPARRDRAYAPTTTPLERMAANLTTRR
jgi:hypothetical protein